MIDNEMLLALSNMLDSKLEPINQRLDNLETKVDSLDVKVNSLETKVDSLNIKVNTLESRIDIVETKVTRTNLTLEHDILPRLQNIESCYVTTYDRYRTSIKSIEVMQSDIELLKKVVREHSDKINKIA